MSLQVRGEVILIKDYEDVIIKNNKTMWTDKSFIIYTAIFHQKKGIVNFDDMVRAF